MSQKQDGSCNIRDLLTQRQTLSVSLCQQIHYFLFVLMPQTKARHLPHKPSFFTIPNVSQQRNIAETSKWKQRQCWGCLEQLSQLQRRFQPCWFMWNGSIWWLSASAANIFAVRRKTSAFLLDEVLCSDIFPSTGLIFWVFSPNMCSQSCESVCRQYFILAPKQVPNDQFA